MKYVVEPAAENTTRASVPDNVSSSHATRWRSAREVPVYTATTVSKSLPSVSAAKTPSAVGVNSYHTECLVSSVQDVGSPGSTVASAVFWMSSNGSEATTLRPAKLSPGGGAAP